MGESVYNVCNPAAKSRYYVSYAPMRLDCYTKSGMLES